MIEFFYEGDFRLKATDCYSDWINRIIKSENVILATLNFIFCEDDYLLNVNQEYLNHDYFTDIITFDYTQGKDISYGISFETELLRVMAHGVLHLLGYNDKMENDIMVMRKKEEEKIKMFHVEQS